MVSRGVGSITEFHRFKWLKLWGLYMLKWDIHSGTISTFRIPELLCSLVRMSGSFYKVGQYHKILWCSSVKILGVCPTLMSRLAAWGPWRRPRSRCSWRHRSSRHCCCCCPCCCGHWRLCSWTSSNPLWRISPRVYKWWKEDCLDSEFTRCLSDTE